MNKRHIISITGILIVFLVLLITFLGGSKSASCYVEPDTSSKILHFDNNKTKIDVSAKKLDATICIVNPERQKTSGKLFVSLLDPDGKSVAATRQEIFLRGQINNIFNVNLPVDTDRKTLMSYRLHYVFKYGNGNTYCPPNTKCDKSSDKIEGLKSVYSATDHLSLRMLAQSNYISGAPASFRLVAFNPASSEPVNNADVTVKLATKEGAETLLYTGKTNNVGTVNANFSIPEDKEGSYDLKIAVAASIPQKAEEVISQPIKIKRDYKIMISTDKPIYQPNQTIKIRALALNSGTLNPVSNKESYIEVFDAKGNKVFKKKIDTDKFGITSADFTLADEINMGNYKIKAIIDKVSSEKTVKVSRYVLPKFKVVFNTDKAYYLPSETVKGTVDANYFFGKSLNDAEVTIKVDKYDIGFSTIQEIKGKTDTSGHFDFEIRLPDSFVGQNLASGNALVKFDIKVKDTAEHSEQKTASVLVSQQPININVIPESGNIAKNIDNMIYVMTTYPDGSPAITEVKVKYDNQEKVLNTDSSGIATFSAKINNANLNIISSAMDSKGNKASQSFNLSTEPSENSILLRTSKAIAKVGETINIQTLSTKSKGTVYIDMIKNSQTVLTKSMDIKNGHAEMAFDIPPELAGTIGINAYIIDQSSEIIRDSKIVYINQAEDLIISIKADKKTYKPAEEAVINFKVTDSNKHPVLAALGIYVVDESVFALSELQPGLEKVFFTLEEEIMKPRFEIHGLTPEQVIKPLAEERDQLAERQQQAARVLFAAAENIKDYTVNIDTYSDNIENLISAYQNTLYDKQRAIQNAFYALMRKNNNKGITEKEPIKVLIAGGYLKKSDSIDPWGNMFVMAPINDRKIKYFHDYVILSKGPDGVAGTSDDLAMTEYYGITIAIDLENPSIMKDAFEGKNLKEVARVFYSGRYLRRKMQRFMVEEGMMLDAMPAAGVMGAARNEAVKASKPMEKEAKKDKSATAASGDSQEIRVRDYFPETLYANPSVITDANGNASITIPMADSITTWRLSAMANSLKGLLGSNTSGIRVFQDFFIDIDLPVSLTENDKVRIPVAIYNYLPSEQTIKLKMLQEDWYKTDSGLEKSVKLGPNQVSVEYFSVEVTKLGNHTLTVYAYGSKLSDAIKRQVRVEPDGEEFRDAINGRLDAEVSHDIVIPAKAIDDASRILVKVYPGYLSQVVEGLDKIFRMPSGCFEQTSSVTYPNILVLDYMKRTSQISPEIQMKAESYINSGYQRLLTFEVPGGGFDWFGRPPANKILTAYGLMEFFDMSAVHEVDPNIITRTQNWLISKQEADGAWTPDEGGIAEGAINQYRGHKLRTTAYIGWALASSNYDGPALDKAVTYIKKHIDEAEDAYTYAVLANLLVLNNPDDPITDQVFNSLLKLKKEKDDTIYWEQKNETPMFGGGISANIEVTALATIALINYGKEVGTTNKALNYLIQSKDTFGTWHTTQATILSMKALLMSMGDATSKVNATIKVLKDGKEVDSFKLDDSNSDVLKQIDLKNMTSKGKNNITLKIDGHGSMLYQIVSIYYIPWDLLDKPKVPELSIDVSYDKTTLDKDDYATAEVIVQNNTDKTANMVIVDLGIPPGFEVQTEDLDKLVSSKLITRYSIAARQIILYFDKITPNNTLTFNYRLKARLSIKAQSGKSKVYKYYEPGVNNTSEPVEITVR
jgi:hypothetical protein